MEYTKLEYIESTGTQYINTKEQIWNTSKYKNWKIDFDFTPTATYNFNAIFGLASGRIESWINSSKNFYFGYDNEQLVVNTIIIDTRYHFIADYKPSTLTLTINDATRSVSYNAPNFASDLYVGYGKNYYGKFKIYSLKLYGDGVLVKDFIPCEYNGAIGLWDKVTNQFFANNGTGEFVAGPTIGPRTLKVKMLDKNNLYKKLEYTKLEYIEGTGTQYIDLGFKLSSNHAVDLDLQMVKLNANIFGSRAGAMDRAFTLFSSTSVIMTDMGDTRNSTSPTTDRINVYLSSKKVKIGTYERNINSGSFTTPGNGYIFNISYSRPQYYMASMKLYGCKIYLSGTLIRDLIPCKYNNKIGLWDTINGSFLGNAGTGEFVAGPEQGEVEVTIKYTELEYIEGTGTQYINTGVNNINGVEIQFQYLAYKQNASAFGARNGDASDSRFGLTLYDGYFHIMPPGQNVNGIITNKHIFKFGSNVNYQCYMDGELKINKIPTYKSSYNTYLFCECSGGYSSFYSNNLKIYYCKLYKDEILVRDFIPCEYNGKIGLWDRVSETFFANNGTGEFVAGPYSLIGKTVSKINGKYAKTINGVSVQCWKKKENPGPHDNILVAGTYKWVDTLGSFSSGSIQSNFNFVSNSESFDGIFLSNNGEVLEYLQDRNARNVYMALRGWSRANYKTIVLSTEKQVDATFYNWAVTQGNLIYQGG